jgi:hypothetical protein
MSPSLGVSAGLSPSARIEGTFSAAVKWRSCIGRASVLGGEGAIRSIWIANQTEAAEAFRYYNFTVASVAAYALVNGVCIVPEPSEWPFTDRADDLLRLLRHVVLLLSVALAGRCLMLPWILS